MSDSCSPSQTIAAPENETTNPPDMGLIMLWDAFGTSYQTHRMFLMTQLLCDSVPSALRSKSARTPLLRLKLMHPSSCDLVSLEEC